MIEGYSRGVGVMIVQNNKLLLTYRIKGDQLGVWEVVAGHIESYEKPEDTAIRETKEETGIDIRITRHIGKNIDDTHRFEADIFLAEVVSGEIQNLDPRNHSELKWFELTDLPCPLGSTTIKGLELLEKKDLIQ